ncbi:MAG: glycerophosphodiester phosphodiesterase family protein [Devosia sp.]|nr:glycerophosphodiester phosphodiesterase family protein [Devosia sp.]
MAPRPKFDRPIAHRGLHDRAAGVIENSRTAFERAVERGLTIECDVQLSSDGVPIVFHDDALERLTGVSGFVRGTTADELTALPLLDSAAGDRPQRFTAFLEQIAGRTLLQIELKKQQGAAAGVLAKRVADALASYSGPVTVESFDPALITLVRRFGFKGPVGIITYRYDKPEWEIGLSNAQRGFLRYLLHWPWSRFSFISCHFEALNLPVVRCFRGLGMPVTAWTIRTPEEARLAAAGADQIVFEGFDPESA